MRYISVAEYIIVRRLICRTIRTISRAAGYRMSRRDISSRLTVLVLPAMPLMWMMSSRRLIISDDNKMFYYRGLSEWGHVDGYLTDTCLSAQDDYKAVMEYFKIPQ